MKVEAGAGDSSHLGRGFCFEFPIRTSSREMYRKSAVFEKNKEVASLESFLQLIKVGCTALLAEKEMREEIGVERESLDVLKMNADVAERTILLVEDEEMVRELMVEVLERDGYRVLSCSHPQEGIEVSEQYSGRIDLLLTDVVMPGMNGWEMANRILEHLPTLRVVFMSGYAQHALLEEREAGINFEYLQKPFTLKTLTRKLAHAFGTAQRVQ